MNEVSSSIIRSLLLYLISIAGISTSQAFDVPYPSFRYREFSSLSPEEQSAAIRLGYDESSWNRPGTADVEFKSFWYIANDYYDADGDKDTSETHPFEYEPAIALGFDEDVWDCWQNHYTYYSWDDLELYGLDAFWKDLGWSEHVWTNYYYIDDGEYPETNLKSWSELSTKEKTAALRLCYTQELWDYDTLPFCDFESSAHICDWVGDDLNFDRCLSSDYFSDVCKTVCGSCDDPHSVIESSTAAPTILRTFAPTGVASTSEPVVTVSPSSDPTTEPTAEPTSEPTTSPTSVPTLEPASDMSLSRDERRQDKTKLRRWKSS